MSTTSGDSPIRRGRGKARGRGRPRGRPRSVRVRGSVRQHEEGRDELA